MRLKAINPTVLLFLFFLVSCISDYDIGDTLSGPKECIGINAILNPLKPIQIDLFKLEKEEGKYQCVSLKNALVLLKENEDILYEGIADDSVLILTQHPLADKTYSIEVQYEGMQTVKAKTTVPQAIRCKASVEVVKNAWWNWSWASSGYLVKLTAFETHQVHRAALWITTYEADEENKLSQYLDIFCNTVLGDKENSSIHGNGAINKWVGSICYDYFLRVKNKNIYSLDELVLTPSALPKFEGFENSKCFLVKLITASAEYDQYCKTLYRQKLTMDYDDDALSMMIYQPETVYNNIENGLGIFAAINEENYYFDSAYK